MTKTYKINGKNIGTGESVKYDWTEGDDIRIVEVQRADQTGDINSVMVKISRNTAEECESELNGQISDGLFENEKVEKVTAIISQGEKYGRIGENLLIEWSIPYGRNKGERTSSWFYAEDEEVKHLIDDCNGKIIDRR